MKNSIIHRKSTNLSKRNEPVITDVYPIQEGFSLKDDSVIKKRAEEARAFLERVGLPDFEKLKQKKLNS